MSENKPVSSSAATIGNRVAIPSEAGTAFLCLGSKLRLHEFLLWTKMVDNFLVFDGEVFGDEVIVRTNDLGVRGQAAAAEEAALHAAL